MRAQANPSKPQKTVTFPALGARNRKPVGLAPRVVPIYWDARFLSHPLDITVFDEFLRALFQSSWMTELADSGVAPAQLLPSFVPGPAPAAKLTRRGVETTVLDWVNRGLVTPGLGRNDEDLFYVVLARFKPEPTGVPGSRCIAIPLLDIGPELLEVHSAMISRALATAFMNRSAAALAPSRTSPARRSLPARR
ncbi:MAG: hypothetical protein M3020_16600 [Myxococcota bacterium]|nr:hypothetical protein [Myxococcota bacterium]